MEVADYQPGPAGEASLRPEGGRWTLVLVRDLSRPPAAVWRALTDPAEIRQWAPFDADRDLGRLGQAALAMAGGPTPEALPATVRRADAPRVLEYTWGEDLVRWELEPTASGTRLTLRHTIDDRTWIPKVAAGWHICLDVCDRLLSGDPIGRIVAAAALLHGWDRLNDEYAAHLGVESLATDAFPESRAEPGG